MKANVIAKQRLIRGSLRAVFFSSLIHIFLFLFAGALVVYTVSEKEDREFTPPTLITPPKMPLKKLKVFIKKRPSNLKPLQKIKTTVSEVKLNSSSFPEDIFSTHGSGSGIYNDPAIKLSDFVEFEDVDRVTIFGDNFPSGNDLVGTFYDLKRLSSGGSVVLAGDEFHSIAGKFVRNGWNPAILNRYYRSENKLYATSIMIPPMLSALAPAAFNEPSVEGVNWLVHYKGVFTYPKDIRFRFWGSGDDVLVVRINKDVVLNACWLSRKPYYSDWLGDRTDYQMGNNKASIGKWIDLKANTQFEMEVLIGEQWGGIFNAMLCVEVDGERYSKNRYGGPTLPMFKTGKPSRDLLDKIYYNLYAGEATITNGPVFSDM